MMDSIIRCFYIHSHSMINNSSYIRRCIYNALKLQINLIFIFDQVHRELKFATKDRHKIILSPER